MHSSTFLPLLPVVFWLFKIVHARAVFAHYLIGNVFEEDAHTDIDDAIAMGLDAFALNIGDPTAPFVSQALSYLFPYAGSRGFKLFLSMDLLAKGSTCSSTGSGCGGLADYDYIFTQYAQSGAWFLGENGKPLVSTFSAADLTAPEFQTWRATHDVYFVPDFDNTQGYYDASNEAWYDYWGGVVDGLFSWESTWPQVGATDDGDVTLDKTVLNNAVNHQKSYMIGLSMLQYKNAYNTNLYRHGEQTIAARMENILAINPAPLYVEIMTWNDGPEGHYIGNIWAEQNGDAQPATYATQRGASHTGIQPLLTEFTNAFRGQSASFPPSQTPVGAIWYKTILQSTTCPDNELGGFYSPPSGASSGVDAINWAVVLPSNGASYTIQFMSNGGAVSTPITGKPGFQHGSVLLSTNAQYMKIVDQSGTTKFSTGLGRCVSSVCFDDIYNYNPQVLGLEQGDHASVGCWQMTQQARASNGATNGPFYPAGI